MDSFQNQYITRTLASKELFERASRVLPGGVAGNGKFLPPYPVYLVGAQGGEIVDKDGNKYIDLIMGGGVHILGHSPAPVLKAVHEQLDMGVHFYIPTEAEVRLAEKVTQLMPHVEMIRFVNTGSEATQMAIRVARAFRKRDKIIKFEGNFHGQHESVLVSTLGVKGPNDSPQPHLDSAGVPTSISSDTVILPYNDPECAVERISQLADTLGAVIMEPVSAFGLGVVPAELEFLRAVRDVTARHEIPLIFDEVVTNFRIRLGGATEYFGIQPDLVALGKILGGGFAIGGFGGRRDIMEKVVTPKVGLWDLSEQIFQSGNFSGNPVSMTAGLVVLEELEKGHVHPHVTRLTKMLVEGLQEIGNRLGYPLLVNHVASMIQIHFGVEKIRNKRDAMTADRATTNTFHLGLRTNGVMASYHPLFISNAHTEEQMGKILDTAESVLQQMKA